jgi:hypothetical protein
MRQSAESRADLAGRAASGQDCGFDVMDPITGVFAMAGPHNTLRRLVVDGTP